MSSTHDERQVARVALTVLLGAALLRTVASVVSGLIALSEHVELDTDRLRVGRVLAAFGTAGDSTQALLGAAAVGLLWWLGRRGARPDTLVVRLVLLATLVMVVAHAAGFAVIDSDTDRAAGEFVVVFGFAAADGLLAAGSLLVLGRVGRAGAATSDPDQLEPLLFAVDRGNGEVFAFFSFNDARRTISVYSIEEAEYVFYTDEGDVVTASVGENGTTFTVTDEGRRDDLMQALRAFAQAKDLTVEEPAEPTSYAVPISDWQWLELWPGWLRPIGRAIRRLRG